jgi:NADPH:quinone reductase-like Zn-dependent oxidoreductase
MQIAKKVGAVPVALTRGASKREALLDAGAAHVIATDEQDLVKEIHAITRDQGARVVFDPVAGATLAKLTQATAPHGLIVVSGALAPEPTPFPLFDVVGKGITIRGYSTTEVVKDPQRIQRALGFHQRRLGGRQLKASHR